jgi:hypothetical protein
MQILYVDFAVETKTTVLCCVLPFDIINGKCLLEYRGTSLGI